MMKRKAAELPIIQQTYDLILWYVPIINKLPRDHKFALGDRIVAILYDILEELIQARYETKKLARLQAINAQLDLLRYQTRMLRDFDLIDVSRYGNAARQIEAIGSDLGGWINQQKSLTP